MAIIARPESGIKAMAENAVSGQQDVAFRILADALKGQTSRSAQKPPFPGGPATSEWRVMWEGGGARGRLVARIMELDGQRTDSTWLSIEDAALGEGAWLRVATKAMEEMCLGARVARRRGSFGSVELDGALVQGLPPGEAEILALYGPLSEERDVAGPIRATDALVGRMRGAFAEVLPRLQSIGDFTIEVEDGTMNVRYAAVFPRPEVYRSIVECARKLIDAAR